MSGRRALTAHSASDNFGRTSPAGGIEGSTGLIALILDPKKFPSKQVPLESSVKTYRVVFVANFSTRDGGGLRTTAAARLCRLNHSGRTIAVPPLRCPNGSFRNSPHSERNSIGRPLAVDHGKGTPSKYTVLGGRKPAISFV